MNTAITLSLKIQCIGTDHQGPRNIYVFISPCGRIRYHLFCRKSMGNLIAISSGGEITYL